MEHQKITNLLDTTSDNAHRFITKRWLEVHDHSGSAEDRYKPSKQIRFKISMLRSDLYDYSDAYIVVLLLLLQEQKEQMMKTEKNRSLAFKNNAPFTACISKINNGLIDNAEDLDVVIPMYNLIEHSKNYREATCSLWNYQGDEISDDTNDNNNLNKNIINSKPF